MTNEQFEAKASKISTAWCLLRKIEDIRRREQEEAGDIDKIIGMLKTLPEQAVSEIKEFVKEKFDSFVEQKEKQFAELDLN